MFELQLKVTVLLNK